MTNARAEDVQGSGFRSAKSLTSASRASTGQSPLTINIRMHSESPMPAATRNDRIAASSLLPLVFVWIGTDSSGNLGTSPCEDASPCVDDADLPVHLLLKLRVLSAELMCPPRLMSLEAESTVPGEKSCQIVVR